MSYLKSEPVNLSNSKILWNNAFLTPNDFWFFNNEIWHFWARILKNYCHIWNHYPQICLFAKFHKKTKMPKFGAKSAWFGYFGVGIWKQYCHIWNQDPGIYLTAKFDQKTKMSKFGTKNALFGYFWPKMPYLGIFWEKFKKYHCHIWNQHPQICRFSKIHEKTKIPKFGTKMPDLSILGLEFESNIVIFEISSLEFM